MHNFSQGDRAHTVEQALAHAGMDRVDASPEFLADMGAVMEGRMTLQQAREASRQRALAEQRATAVGHGA